MRHSYRSIGFAMVMVLVHACTAFAMSPVLREMEDAFVRIHEEVRPCVVNINTEGKVPDMEDMGPYEDIFKFFGIPFQEGAPNMPSRPIPKMATGSGFIFDAQGHIITNNHVVEEAETIKVRLWDGSEYEAQVVGRDPDTDLAVIKIEADKELPVAKLGNSDALKVGQFAIAMGSPRGFEGSLSFGHVSALGRDELHLPGLRFQNFIQTDAAINLGNSGGPLCNIDGEVIGINVAIVYGANSLGFAIPVNTAKEIVPTLISEGKVTRGYLGVEITKVSDLFAEGLGLEDTLGAFVNRVQPGTPAERAGLQRYDVVRKVNGESVSDSADLVRKISSYAPGAKIMLEVWREKAPVEVEVTLEEYAGSMQKAVMGKEILGLQVETLTAQMAERLGVEAGTEGVVVTSVAPGSPGDYARLMQGDVIIEVAQKKVTDAASFFELVQQNSEPGKALLIGYIRGSDGNQGIAAIKVPEE